MIDGIVALVAVLALFGWFIYFEMIDDTERARWHMRRRLKRDYRRSGKPVPATLQPFLDGKCHSMHCTCREARRTP